MRKIKADEIKKAVGELCIEANISVRPDVLRALKRGSSKERRRVSRKILELLIENARIASKEKLPLCQDTGMAVVFLKIGQEVQIVGGALKRAIDEGVRKGYRQGYLRKSVVGDPLRRKNTGDNTPAIVYTDIVDGDRLKIAVAPRGFGAENMGRVKMLRPSDGIEQIEDFVIETVKEAGANACPPIIVGVGIGGTMEKAALLSKEAVLRPIDKPHPQPSLVRLERRILKKINLLGIGPMGLGGKTTALGVNVVTFPTHIAGLPVAVNISCHATRSATKIL